MSTVSALQSLDRQLACVNACVRRMDEAAVASSSVAGNASGLKLTCHLLLSAMLSLQEAYVPQALRQNIRVTLQMGAQPNEFTLQQPGLGSGQQVLFGQLAESSSPREQQGTYWGYTTRLASTLSQVFTDSPFEVRHGSLSRPATPYVIAFLSFCFLMLTDILLISNLLQLCL